MTEKYDLTDVAKIQLNESNPRTIKERKFGQLVNSLLALPWMMHVRPIVLDEDGTVLGGNMRVRALQLIATLSFDEITRRLKSCRDYQQTSRQEQAETLEYWRIWLDHPIVPSATLEGLPDRAKQQFVIKDNASYGDWDWNKLANEWQTVDLNEWGLDLWGTDETVAPAAEGDTTEEAETPENASNAKTDVQTKITITVQDPTQYAQILAAVELAVDDYQCTVK